VGKKTSFEERMQKWCGHERGIVKSEAELRRKRGKEGRMPPIRKENRKPDKVLETPGGRGGLV